MSIDFLVSVRCFTYNQSAYIKDALNGFVMQQTNFPFVVLVVDDASTDGEQEVIRKFMTEEFELSDASVAYEKETEFGYIQYAQHKTNKNCFMVAMFLKENHYSQKKKKFPYLVEWRDNVKYEAICEGDDYWIDPLKLQKQVDFLEENPDYSMVHTGFCCVDENSVQMYVDKFQARLNESIEDTKKNKLNRDISRLKRALSYMSKSESGFIYYKLLTTSNYIMTVTVLIRKDVVNMIPRNGLYFDYGFFLVAARLGYVGYIPDCTSSYRFTPGSIVSNPKSLRELGVKKRKLLLFEISKLLKRECCCIEDVFTFPNYRMLVSRVLVNLLRKGDWTDKFKILVLVFKNVDLYVPFLCSLIFRYDVNKLYECLCQKYISK